MTTEVKDVLSGIAMQLERMTAQSSFVNDGFVRVIDPVYLIDKIREAASLLESLSSQADVLERDVTKFQAIAEDKLADTRLVNAGGRLEGGFGFDFTGGPIPYIAEYLFQFIGARDDDKPMSNYAEIEVRHNEFGRMTLTLQRHTGQTPHQLRTAAESRATAAEGRVALLEEERDEQQKIIAAFVQRFELYSGPNDMHAGKHDLELLTLARARLAKGGQ
jgi:hypothetical protein